MNSIKLLNITIIYENRKHNLFINPNELYGNFANVLSNTFTLSLSEFDVIYNSLPLQYHTSKELLMKDIINTDPRPIFTIVPKTLNKLQSCSTKALLPPSYAANLTIQLDHYPSTMDITMQLQHFCDSQLKTVKYDIDFVNNSCRIHFKESTQGYAFINFIHNLKTINQLYQNIKINLDYSRNNHQGKDVYLTPVKGKTGGESCRSLKNSHCYSSAKMKVEDCSFDYVYPGQSKQKYRILNEYYARQKYIRNASPYLSQSDKYRIEEIEGKKKWVSNKSFVSAVGKYSRVNHDIKNYVNGTPSESPLVYKFREERKQKWITPKGFY